MYIRNIEELHISKSEKPVCFVIMRAYANGTPIHKMFEERKVRTHWDKEQEKWYFSIIDVIEVLSGTERPRKYWNDLKSKLIKEGSQLSEKNGQLKMSADDGKMRLTDVADTE